jgi:hypothetical protein
MAVLNPAQQRKILKIIHLALIASVVIYGGIAFAISAQPTATPHQRPGDLLLYVLAGVAATVLVVVAPMMHRTLMPPPDERDAKVDKVRSASIVTWALCESAAINGLIAALLYREPLYYLPFGAAAIAGMIVFAPRG